MATPRIGILPTDDRMAIFNAARRLKLDPYELGGFLSLESGPNMDPNIRGGEGGNYYGMIQFGPSERKKYLDPNKIGKYTRAEQMPQAVQFLLDRGFKPGQMGIDRAYATVLGGNPNVSLQAKDSFGTSVAGALPRFTKGGDLYENARRVLGDIPSEFSTPQEAQVFGATDQLTKKQKRKLKKQFQNPLGLPVSININLSGEEEAKPEARSFLDTMKGQVMQSLFQQRPQFGLQEVLGLLGQ